MYIYIYIYSYTHIHTHTHKSHISGTKDTRPQNKIKKYRWNQRHQTSTTLAYLPLPCASSIKKGIFVCANIGFFLHTHTHTHTPTHTHVISSIAMRLIPIHIRTHTHTHTHMRLINQGYFLLPKTPDLNDFDISSIAIRLINQAFCCCMYIYIYIYIYIYMYIERLCILYL
jgi:hypothetical protein